MSRTRKKNKWDYQTHEPKDCSKCWHNRPKRQMPEQDPEYKFKVRKKNKKWV